MSARKVSVLLFLALSVSRSFVAVAGAGGAGAYGKGSAEMIYQGRAGSSSQRAAEERALLKDLTRCEPYMKNQFVPMSSLPGGASPRSRHKTGYQMEKLDSINRGELTPEQYRAALQDFIRSRESTPQVRKNEFKHGPSAPPAAQPKTPVVAAEKKRPEDKKRNVKNPIDEYLDKLAAAEDKAAVASAKNSAGGPQPQAPKATPVVKTEKLQDKPAAMDGPAAKDKTAAASAVSATGR